MNPLNDQNQFLGHCYFCGAKMYQIDEEVKSIDPAPGCLCKARKSSSDLWNRIMSFQCLNRRKASTEDQIVLTNLLYIAHARFYIPQLLEDLSIYPLFDAAAMAVSMLEEDFSLEEFVKYVEISLRKEKI